MRCETILSLRASAPYHGMELMYTREYAQADSVLQAVLADEPGYGMALTTLSAVYHLVGDHERALAMWRQSNAGDPEVLDALDEGYASGGYEEALRSVARLFIARSDTTYVPPWQIGTLFTRAGDVGPALEWLERAYEEHDQNIPPSASIRLRSAARRPRFRAMIERLGLPE